MSRLRIGLAAAVLAMAFVGSAQAGPHSGPHGARNGHHHVHHQRHHFHQRIHFFRHRFFPGFYYPYSFYYPSYYYPCVPYYPYYTVPNCTYGFYGGAFGDYDQGSFRGSTYGEGGNGGANQAGRLRKSADRSD